MEKLMEKIILGISDILTAFDEFGTVGTKVISGAGEFQQLLRAEIKKLENEEGHDLKTPKFFGMPTDAYHLVRNGVALREGLSEKDKHYREYRGDDMVFAYPMYALPKVESLGVLVFPVSVYLADPEVTDAERSAHLEAESTHVMVAVHSGPSSLSYLRLVHNIAGGNNSIDGTHSAVEHDLLLLHDIIKKAKATKEYEQRFIVVAEPVERV